MRFRHDRHFDRITEIAERAGVTEVQTSQEATTLSAAGRTWDVIRYEQQWID